MTKPLIISYAVTKITLPELNTIIIPEAAVGNIKDPAKIAEKQAAHREKYLESLSDNPLYASVVEVEAKASGNSGIFTGNVFEFDDWVAEYVGDSDPYGLYHVGPHPTTDGRLIVATYLRLGGKQLKGFKLATNRVVNPWRLIYGEEPEDCVMSKAMWLEQSLLLAEALGLK